MLADHRGAWSEDVARAWSRSAMRGWFRTIDRIYNGRPPVYWFGASPQADGDDGLTAE